MSLESGLERGKLSHPTTSLDLFSLSGLTPTITRGAESKAVSGILDGFRVGDFNAGHSTGTYEFERNSQGLPTTVRDQSGHTLRRFEYQADGRTLNKATDEKGSELRQIQFNDYRWVSPEGWVSGVTLKDVRVDSEANLHYRNDNSVTSRGEAVLKPDGTTETTLDSRKNWGDGTYVQPTGDGMIVRSRDGKELREIVFDNRGRPALVLDADGNRWDSTDGGATIRRTLPDGSVYTYSNANMVVDSQGNISYNTPYDQAVTETANGRLITKNRT
jgi:hypothetical protein